MASRAKPSPTVGFGWVWAGLEKCWGKSEPEGSKWNPGVSLSYGSTVDLPGPIRSLIRPEFTPWDRAKWCRPSLCLTGKAQ